MEKDAVFQDDRGWWHYDETWADVYGPFPSEIVARDHLKLYINWLETGQY